MLALALLTACTDDPSGPPPPPSTVAAAQQRVDDVQGALARWREATTIGAAHHAAETVSNLITGPGVDLYGDTDADGTVQGAVDAGLLPGQAREASLGLPLSGCAGADLLGGSWADPAARWLELTTRLDAWTPENNPFPELASHAQRTVGWAQLTLRSDDLADAQEFSGHAQLHVSAVLAALDDCR